MRYKEHVYCRWQDRILQRVVTLKVKTNGSERISGAARRARHHLLILRLCCFAVSLIDQVKLLILDFPYDRYQHKGLTPLSLEIFHELVTAYLEDGLPVGSSRLAKSGKFDFSPASIRSKMSDLEDAGLLFAPHTSSGRVPTETGLRMFVMV